MARTSMYLNSNILVAVDAQMTGIQVDEHDIWQICILPLDSEMKPMKGITPFYLELKPRRPDNVTDGLARPKLAELLVKGMDADVATDLLSRWFIKLNLPDDKKIMPIAYNWPLLTSFLKEWMGSVQYDHIFHPWYRDLIPVTAYANDGADLNNEQIQYPKSFLPFICSRLKVLLEDSNDSLSRCVAIAECYNKMLKRLF